MDILSFFAENFDLPILDWIQANMTNPVLDFLMPIITLLGDAGIFWIVCASILALTKKYRRIGFGMAFALMMGLVVCNMILKPGVGRIRPYDFQMQEFGKEIILLIDKQHDFSFPSGHTIASFEACTVLLLGNKKMGIPATILAILIAFSRMYLYVHYPTDVLVSVVLGSLFAVIGHILAQKINLPEFQIGKRGKFQA
jgi:undecaprenyl-diphosphatase